MKKKYGVKEVFLTPLCISKGWMYNLHGIFFTGHPRLESPQYDPWKSPASPAEPLVEETVPLEELLTLKNFKTLWECHTLRVEGM